MNNEMKQCNHVMVVSGGNCSKQIVKKLILERGVDTIIAVDGGLKVLDEVDIVPDYIVGDFDTISKDILRKYESNKKSNGEKGPVIKSFCPEKDDTDTEIAVRLCVSLKPHEVTIVGATGTRLDHTMANIHLMRILLDAKIKATIYDDHNKIYLIDDNTTLAKAKLYGNYVSLLPLTNQVSKITLTGFKYPLVKRDICIGTSLCISNEVTDDQAMIEFEDGILIVFESKD